ncbi:MAG: LysR family transcriptional regulator [Gammaproteobacteria bacterium]|nr:LysR family transcriptional regulator [Gammaproteobacteria bacterium]
MLNELRQIAIFAKTVDHGSFRGAAKALRLSPSVVSHHVGQLEERLGTALLYRSTRKLTLTQDGKCLLAAAHNMINAAEAGLQHIANQTHQLSGVLRLTAPAVLAPSNLMDQLAEFTIRYPRVNLSVDFSDDRRDIINDGYDVAIRVGELKDSSLKSIKLFDIHRQLVVAPSYLKTRPKPLSPSELSDWDWLELAPVWRKKPTFCKAGKRQLVSKQNSRISVNNVQALSQLTRAGAGIAIVPELIAEPDIVKGNLVHLLPDWITDPVATFAVWPSNAPKHGLIKHFVDFLKNS